jgi:hypothetical protein
MKQERYRVCAVCGRRHSPTRSFQSILEGLGMRGVWAAPGCLAKLISFRAAQRRLQQTNIDTSDVQADARVLFVSNSELAGEGK